MYINVTKSIFHDQFNAIRPNNFSYEALDALYYLIEYEESYDQRIELDVIALCCEYAEDTIENVLESYGLLSLEDLEDNTYVIWNDGKNVLYQQY